MEYCKRLIEVDLPIKRISEHARREKSIKHGHISTLHIWWARRPLAACRAVICASLWPDPADHMCPDEFKKSARHLMTKWAEAHLKLLTSKESINRFIQIQKNPEKLNDNLFLRQTLLDFIADFANWDNSTISEYLETSRAITKVAHESLGGVIGTRPMINDPFSGGGAMPLEALRVGADAFASDLNPIAVLLNKIALEFVPKYRSTISTEVKKWGDWVKKRATVELSKFYPDEKDGSTVIGYLWARTIICEGPGCGVIVPIIKNFSISNRKDAEAAILISYNKTKLETYVVTGTNANKIHGGTSKRSSVTCPLCGFTTARIRVEKQSNEKGFGFQLLAVCARKKNGKRIYRQPDENDLKILMDADKELIKWSKKIFNGLTAFPIDELPYLRSIFNVRVYGIDQWHKLFHRRQLLSAIVFTNITREAIDNINKQYSDKELAMAIAQCLSLSVSNAFQYQCNIATYLTEGIKSAFIQGQSLPMKMDFIEANPLMEELAGSYAYSLSQHISGLDYLSSFQTHCGVAQQVSALKSVLPEDSIDLLATDPPYYDVVPYADCSDFFYVWLRRMLSSTTVFSTKDELTPKDDEIVQLAERNEKYRKRTKNWFENKMCEALSVARINVKPAGIAVIVFAHKETTAWEALLQSVLDAGWIVTGSWPIDTETGTRLRAQGSAVLSSSIHLVCRPRENPDGSVRVNDIGDWRDVLAELPKRIHEWMPRLAEEGVVGADAIFACLGPALEIFSRYSRVEKASGEQVTLKEYLEQVWAVVAKEALNMIFEGADTAGFEEDARLTAMWLWTLSTDAANGEASASDAEEDEADEEKAPKAKLSGYTLEYDAARKIAQGLGAHLERMQSLVEVKGDTARLLPVGERTKSLFGKEDSESPASRRRKKSSQLELGFMEEVEKSEQEGSWGQKNVPQLGNTRLDRLHQSMILFAAGRGEALKRFLVEEGVGRDQRFWRLAQALSALYPSISDEKRWVDGVLARKKGLGF